VTYSLRRPLEGLSFFQRLVWPLIFAQLWALKMWVRRHYGRGVPYRIGISPAGCVHLVRMPMDAAQSYAAPGALVPGSYVFSSGLVRPEFLAACAPEEASRAPAPERIVRMEMDYATVCVPGFNTS